MKKDNKKTEELKTLKIAPELFKYISKETSDLYNVVPIKKEGDVLYIGALVEDNLDMIDAISFITSASNLEYKIEKINEDEFQALVSQYKESKITSTIEEALEDLDAERNLVLGDDESKEVEEEVVLTEEGPMIKFVSAVLTQAVEKRVSDIHIEPTETESLIRYRVDGVLEKAMTFPKKDHEGLVTRIKVISRLKLDEKRRPQDGRISIQEPRKVDFRVATFPTQFGEKIILRVLDKEKGIVALSKLGLNDTQQSLLNDALLKPYGLILVVGPTGAGKTTTLYSILNMLDKTDKNIVSLEDPVEYVLEGINQSGINSRIGYNFADGLRSILRGDPDHIFVGEIRDKETAQLAVQAALTGHIVYSTLHTNTAIGAISRLINFGIDPFLLAPTLSLVIGQRVVKKLDGEGESYKIADGLRNSLQDKFSNLKEEYKKDLPEFKEFKKAVPTKENPKGTKGRVGIYEVFSINDELQDAILKNKSEGELEKIAVDSYGYMTMEQDAIIKGLKGIIPIDSVIEMTSELASEIDKGGEDLREDKK